MKLLLVDSSAWIGFFSSRQSQTIVQTIFEARKRDRLATCGLVYLEVLRGCRTKKEFNEMTEEFQALWWLESENVHWQTAARIGFYLSQKGLHPPTTDLLIAATAIQGNCQLLHQDKHFLQIARYFPLRVVQ